MLKKFLKVENAYMMELSINNETFDVVVQYKIYAKSITMQLQK